MSEPEIHIVNDGHGQDVEVWLDPDAVRFQGICIGVGDTTATALRDAETELLTALHSVRMQLVEIGAITYGDPSMNSDQENQDTQTPGDDTPAPEITTSDQGDGATGEPVTTEGEQV